MQEEEEEEMMERQPFLHRLEDWFFATLYKINSHKTWITVAVFAFTMWAMTTWPAHVPLFVSLLKWVVMTYMTANVGVKAVSFFRGLVNNGSSKREKS